MKTEILNFQPEGCSDEHREIVTDALCIIQEQHVRVFRTFTLGANKTQGVTFVTTSKDTHLYLGLFEEEALWHLGQLLDSMFETAIIEILLYKDDRCDRGWHVTRNETVDMITFTLSPAR